MESHSNSLSNSKSNRVPLTAKGYHLVSSLTLPGHSSSSAALFLLSTQVARSRESSSSSSDSEAMEIRTPDNPSAGTLLSPEKEPTTTFPTTCSGWPSYQQLLHHEPPSSYGHPISNITCSSQFFQQSPPPALTSSLARGDQHFMVAAPPLYPPQQPGMYPQQAIVPFPYPGPSPHHPSGYLMTGPGPNTPPIPGYSVDPVSYHPGPYQNMRHFEQYFGHHCAQNFIRRRNERERQRVRCVNEGYETLRRCLPLVHKEKRVSKVQILRLAIRYIHALQTQLNKATSRDSQHQDSSKKTRIIDQDEAAANHIAADNSGEMKEEIQS